MFKRVFILLLIITSTNLSFGQFLHIGARGFITPGIIMDFYTYEPTDYVYYFSNDRNETFRFAGFETGTITSFAPSPDIYLRYDLGNHLYFQTDFFSMKFTNEAKYNNSVDYKEFVQEFNPNGNIDNLEYNTIKLRWKFSGNSFSYRQNGLICERIEFAKGILKSSQFKVFCGVLYSVSANLVSRLTHSTYILKHSKTSCKTFPNKYLPFSGRKDVSFNSLSARNACHLVNCIWCA